MESYININSSPQLRKLIKPYCFFSQFFLQNILQITAGVTARAESRFYKPMKKILYILLTLQTLLNLQTVLAQPVTQEWVKRYNGPDNLGDSPKSFAIDKYGNVYVTGVISTYSENLNIATVKYNPGGAQQWAVIYASPGTNADWAGSIAVDSSGNVYIAGFCGPSFGPYAYLTIKYNTYGVEQWVRKYETDDGQTNGICLDKQGNIYVTGGKIAGNIVNPVTIKYNPLGDTIWVRKFTQRYGSGYSVLVDDSSNIYVGGYSYLSNPNVYDFLLIKYNSVGVLQLYVNYSAPGFCNATLFRIALDKVGNCYAVGTQGNCTADTTRMITIKLNRNGVMQWTSLYKGPSGNGSSSARSIIVDSSGSNIYVTGFGLNTGTREDYITIKYNSYGDTLWIQRYNGTGNHDDEAFDLAIDDSANVYITGKSMNSINNFDFCTIKYSTSGTQRWIMNYPGGANSHPDGKSILLDKNHNVYVIGSNSEMGTGLDYITIKYSQLMGIPSISYEISNNYELFQNYPNPFNSKTVIKYKIKTIGKTEISIYDITGRKVSQVVYEEQIPGTYAINFDGENLSSGIYLYSLICNGSVIDTKKLVLIK